jgi:hypothetical protein
MHELMGEDMRNSMAPQKRVAATYDYADENGKVLFQKVRYEPKSFVIRRPDGRGGYEYNRRGIELVPYNLRNWISSDYVFLVEGEKDVETLRKMELAATCSPDGAGNGKFGAGLVKWFTHKSVFIIPDNDEIGKAFAFDEARILAPVAKSVKVLDILALCPDLPEHGDITDIVAHYGTEHTKNALRGLCASTPQYTDSIGQSGRDWQTVKPPEWGEPISFDNPKLPDPLPAQCLGGVYAELATFAARSVQVDISLTVGAVLGAMSTAAMGRWNVQINRDWVTPATLYIGIVAESGEGKSPAMDKAFAPLWAYESEKYNADMQANEFANTDVELLGAELQRVKKEYVGAKDSGKRDAIKSSIQALAAQLADAQPKSPFRLTTTDTTLEKLAKLQADNNGVMAVVSDEGQLIDTAAGMYNSGNCANIDVLLKSHSGQAFTVDRVGKDTIRTQKPRLTICVGLQPYQCEKLLSNVNMRERGLPARFLFVFGASQQGNRKPSSEQIPFDVKERYAAALTAIIKKEPQADGTIALSADARNVWESFYCLIEQELREGGLLSFSPAWAAKFKENIARIAAILHVSESADPENEPIGKEVIANAFCLGYAIAEQSSYIYRSAASADPIEESALYLLKRIKYNGKPELSRSELTRLCRSAKADAVEQAVALLVDRGYLRRGFEYVERKQGGGTGKQIIEVNPALWNKGDA